MTRDEVRNILPDIEDDALGKILDLHSRDIGKAKEDDKQKSQKIEQLQKDIAAKEETILNLEKTGNDIEKMQQELTKYREAENMRQKEEAEKREKQLVADGIKTALGEKEFVNDMTKNGYISEVYKAMQEEKNKGKGISEIFSEMTKDIEGIFKNPQQQSVTIPQAGNGGTAISDEQTARMREIMGLKPIKE